MNRKTATAWQLFDDLPPDARQEVLDFIVFLRSRRLTSRTRKRAKQKNLAKDPFIGLWRDREHMRASRAWVRQTREREWLRRLE